jgi:hypothetical protein
MTVLTSCHPEANGRKPRPGEVEYTQQFPMENGEILTVRMGQAGFDNVTNLLMDMLSGAKPYDDGSTR